jgi:PAS domain S-box-containing protein
MIWDELKVAFKSRVRGQTVDRVLLELQEELALRSKAEADLRLSEAKFRSVLLASPDAVIVVSKAALIEFASDRVNDIFGYSPHELIGKPLNILIPERFWIAHCQSVGGFFDKPRIRTMGAGSALWGRRKDGTEFPVEISLSPIELSGAESAVAAVRDVTNRKAIEAQLGQAQKMEAIGQLTGGLAHDFNNMLTVITGTIGILGEAVKDRADLLSITKLIDDAAQRGARLTQQMLAFARKQPLHPRDVDVNVLVLEAVKLLRPTIGEQITITTQLFDTAWTALVDHNQLATTILNLALNARDAMPNGGKLVLETQNVCLDESYVRMNGDVKVGSYVMIGVSDTGTGIPAHLLGKVFDPFFTTKEVGKGTGLGLSMVFGFVKQSGGHIKIYSEEGRGTTVRIYLPRAVEAQDVAVEAAVISNVEGGEEVILVVEDDALVRRYVVTQVANLGYTALQAVDASEALEIIDSGVAVDLLFTDVILPGSMSGRQLVHEALRRLPSLKTLFTSGYTKNAILHQGRLDPGVNLLQKPYRNDELARKLREVLDV